MAVVVITGGGRRLGRHLALSFAAAGYDVGITVNRSVDDGLAVVETCRSLGVRAALVRADVRDREALVTGLDELRSSLGVPDCVVSNAGWYPDPVPVEALDADAVRAALDVNTLPLVTVGTWYHRTVRETGSIGRLVSISSLGGLELWKDRLPYNVSKSALLTVVRGLARSLAPSIAVNSVAPGAIVIVDEPTAAEATMAAETRIPMGRHGRPDDIVDAVRFFATATPYITGQVLAVDGGYSLVR